ncbi:MAG: ATPase P, partial [Desulfuromonas sp.]
SAWLSLKNRFANMDVLVALGITAAYGYSLLALFGLLGDSATAFFETSAMLILFIRFGKWLEARAKGQASAALKKLLELQADSATLLDGGVERVIPADQVKVGDLLLVRPGDKIPADCVVVEGEAAVDESMITGESLPVEKTLDSKVIGATINRNGRLVIRATAVGEGSVLSNIVRLVEEAQGDKPPIQRLADRISNVFVPLVILLATLTFCGWLLGSDQGFLFAFQMGISVVVIACPCALGLATPTAIMVGSSVGLEHGVLFKKATALEQISKTKVLLLDKTGTLTSGEFKVDRITVVGHFNEGDLLRYAATLESGSAHPLAKGIVAEAEKRQLERLSVSAQQEIGGRGVRGLVGGKEVACGSRDFLIEQGITAAVVDRSPDGDGPGSQIFVAIDGKLQGVIALTDAIRDNVAAVVMRLQHMGILPVMVTGDSRHVAASVARAIGLEHFEAEVLPGQKLDIVKKYQQQGQLVGMVGDGINDAPALAQADIGIAIGSGTDVARETGDLVLISGNLIDIVRSIELGRKTLGKIRQNLFWAFFYNALGIPLAAGLFYPAFGLSLKPEFAGLAMAFSSVSVVTNSLLLRREKRHFLEK